MPKRITNRKVMTPELQGEDSFVVLKSMPYAIIREARKFMLMGDVAGRNDLTPEQITKWQEREQELTEELLFGSVVDWNWVDDQDQPMPVPRTRDDLDKLTADEVAFILNTVSGNTKAEQEE